MDAVKYIRNEAKMTKLTQGANTCGISCNECPFYEDNTGEDLECYQFKAKYPEKAVEIVEKWAAEHPAKTRQSEFLKMFPNASKDMNGDLIICPRRIDTNFSCAKIPCEKCYKEYWLEEVE